MADDKKAQRITILDLTGFEFVAGCFVICSGANPRQIKTIADELSHQMKKRGTFPLGVEGRGEARWVLMDFGDVVVHVFSEEARAFYDLELLWGDAPRIEWQTEAASPVSAE